MITVGAALDCDEPASESGYGRRSVHLAAPGESVLSTHHLPPDGETWKSGTSVSTAFVAGACALVMARHPEWDHSTVRRQVIRSVVPMGDGTIMAAAACCAAGRLDVYNAALVDGLKPNLECPGSWTPPERRTPASSRP
jgi:subtilisin family serine protease